MGENSSNNTQNTADYLAQLLKDKKQLSAFPNVFIHMERLLDEEIGKVRSNLFQINGIKKEPLSLPDADGSAVTQTEKVYVPVKEHPDFNFVGRILGPRGMTAKQLEQETGCKIMVRGRGSMRDKKKEEQNRGKANWEHLNDELHVLITVEDSPNRAMLKLQRAVEEIKKLLVPAADGEDELKKRQLMELAIINGTYRDSSTKGFPHFANHILNFYNQPPRLVASQMTAMTSPMRSPTTPLGPPLILSPRMSMPGGATLLNGSGPPPLIAPGEAGLLYAPYADYHQYALSPAILAEYPGVDHSAAGAVANHRRKMALREHPYQRAAASVLGFPSPPRLVEHLNPPLYSQPPFLYASKHSFLLVYLWFLFLLLFFVITCLGCCYFHVEESKFARDSSRKFVKENIATSYENDLSPHLAFHQSDQVANLTVW